MKKLTLLLIVLLPTLVFAQTKYVTRAGHANLFSTTVAEDITADNYKVTSTINTETGDMVFVIPVQSFEFEKALMQKHFNQEHFMNSTEYPKIKFKGKIQNLSTVKWDTDGKYPVTVEGDLTIRDVTKPISEEGTITIKGNEITANSVFIVKQITDYHVGKPKKKSMSNNVADDIKITFKGIYAIK